MNDKIELDMSAIIQQKIDDALIEVLTSIITDSTDRVIFKEYFKIFSRHGIPVPETIQIITEQMEVLNKYSDEKNKGDSTNV